MNPAIDTASSSIQFVGHCRDLHLAHMPECRDSPGHSWVLGSVKSLLADSMSKRRRQPSGSRLLLRQQRQNRESGGAVGHEQSFPNSAVRAVGFTIMIEGES